MGLIKAAMGAAGGVLADQWKEFFYCDSMPANILMMKGQKRTSSHNRSSNTGGEDNIISNGSKIAVNSGQCMMIVESGKVVDVCSEPGEYIYDKSTEPSIFTGTLKQGIKDMWGQMKERFTFGGDTGKDQRVYYFNMKEILGNKYGTPQEVPFKMKDPDTGQILLIRLRCFGEYSYHIVDPVLFYTGVVGNAADVFDRSQIDSQLKSELLNALQPAIRHRLAYLKTAKPGPHTDAVIGRLHILACYLKKRCILLLQGKEAGMLDARELAMAVEESWRYLEKAGLRGSVGFDLKGNLPVQAALTLYNIFEDVGEEVLARGEAFWLCRFKETEKDWIFSVVLEEKEGETRPASWQALSEYDVSVQCDDTGYGTRLTVRLSRESTDSFT